MSKDHAETFAKLVESIEQSNAALKQAKIQAKKLGKQLGYSDDHIKDIAAQCATQDFSDDNKIVEGVFDGQNMIDAKGETYPVPANYASKSKLVEGDKLKLTIAENGAFVYKQIEPVPRKMAVGHLVLDGSQYQVLADKKSYNVLFASVTFYKASVGDRVTIILPAEHNAEWGTLENVLPEAKEELI